MASMFAAIEITVDYINQHHRFYVDADQSYLPALIRSCVAALSKYPLSVRNMTHPKGAK